ncbi:putative transposase [Pseudomonas frederiksbergensis]|uniref:hypothetical protein n=1 Tax=Pseudomonas frederiksbergensis TaxID=104087 RepID=UPI003D1C18FE
MTFRNLIRNIDLNAYRYINENAVGEDDREEFLKRLQAIELIAAGTSGENVFQQTNIPACEQTRLLKRFLTIDSEGKPVGDRALLPYHRVKPYERKAPFRIKGSQQQGSYSGILKVTLNKYPDVHEKFSKEVISFHSKFPGMKFDKRIFYARFLELLQLSGCGSQEWPFCEKAGGKRTIEIYIDTLLHSKVATPENMQIVEGVATSNNTLPNLINAQQPFDVIQIDAYNIDAITLLHVEPIPGFYVSRTLSRFWILAAVDAISEAVLAAKFVFGSEVRMYDVESLIINAFLGNWQPNPALTVEKLAYRPNSGMLGYLLPETQCMQWGAVYLDNAAAHHGNLIKEKIRDKIGFVINYGQLGQPKRRSIIELTFKQIAQQVMHRLPSTTGSGPKKGRVKDPEKNAEEYEVFADQAEEVLDVWLAGYNITPKEGRMLSKSPYEFARDCLANKKLNLIFPRSQQGICSYIELYQDVEYCVVRGGGVSHAAPYIVVDKARYTNSRLRSSTGFIGTKLLVKINPKDLRSVEAFLPDGESLGSLTVLGYWRNTKHSRLTRKIINKAFRDRTFELTQQDNIVLSFWDHLEKSHNKKSRLERQRLLSEWADDVHSSRPATASEDQSTDDLPNTGDTVRCGDQNTQPTEFDARFMRGSFTQKPGGITDGHD